MKKVLIIDDEFDIIEPLDLLLTEAGYSVQTITKGEETYEKVEHFAPDIILLDVLLSGSDGRIICKNLKNAKKTGKIPIILMSAHPNANADSVGCNADAFIPKPFTTSELLTLIKLHCK